MFDGAPTELCEPCSLRSNQSRRDLSVKTVLVVDDQHDIADSVALLLKFHGYDAQVAYDAEGALARAAERCPDAVVLDLSMPVVNGYEVARSLRAMHGPVPYLVAYTAWSDEETKQRVVASGFDAQLQKPASVEAMIGAIG